MQNEMLKVMTIEVLRYVTASLHSSPFYSIMADETTNSSNCEQVAICFRWVDNSLIIAHEEFIGLQQVDRIDAATITFHIIKYVLQRMNRRWTRARWWLQHVVQYVWCQKRVATNIKSDEPRTVFTHFYGHCINLAASDSMITSRIMIHAIGTTHAITRLIKYSPKRDAKVKQITKSSEGL